MNDNRVSIRGRIASGALAASLALALGPVPAWSDAAKQVGDDFAHRSPGIHWPNGHSPADADLYAHNEGLIDAPCSRVWRHIVEAPKWPAWYPNSHNVRILSGREDRLEAGSRFVWDTFGIHIVSRVHEFVPETRIGWFGEQKGLDAYHTWLLTPAGNGCQVVMEEVVKGPGAVAMRKSDPSGMHKGHDLWLATLKTLSER